MSQNNTNIDSKRLADRQTDELIGICKGILFDGIVSYDEANSLYLWFQANPKAMQIWPGKELFYTLCPMLKNNALSTDDEERLLILLSNIIGLPSVVNSGSNASTQLPLTDPAPAVFFNRRVFVITGNLKIGARRTVIQAIEAQGGEVVLKNIRMDTDYLVIGDIGSKAWMHSTHGRKIEKAIELREQGHGIAIICGLHSHAARGNESILTWRRGFGDVVQPGFNTVGVGADGVDVASLHRGGGVCRACQYPRMRM